MSKKMAVFNDSGLVVNVIICEDTEPETETNIVYTDDNPAYIGGDRVDGYFYSPQPFSSWTRNQGLWNPPAPMPDGYYLWNEESLAWESYEFDPN
jgi:hypothetical protein